MCVCVCVYASVVRPRSGSTPEARTTTVSSASSKSRRFSARVVALGYRPSAKSTTAMATETTAPAPSTTARPWERMPLSTGCACGFRSARRWKRNVNRICPCSAYVVLSVYVMYLASVYPASVLFVYPASVSSASVLIVFVILCVSSICVVCKYLYRRQDDKSVHMPNALRPLKLDRALTQRESEKAIQSGWFFREDLLRLL